MSSRNSEQAREWTQWDFVDALGDGVYGVDKDGRCYFINKAALRILGYDDPAALIGRNMHALIHHTRADGSPFPQAECPLLHTAISGHPVRLENEMLWRRDGTPFLAEYSSFPVRSDGRLVGSVITFNDGMLRQDAQKRLAVQYTVSQLLAGSSDLDAVPERILAAVGSGFGWDVGLFWRREEVSSDHDALRCVAEWRSNVAGADAGFGHGSVGMLLELAAGLPGHVWAIQEPIHIADLSEATPSPRQIAAAEHGLRSGFAFPIMDGATATGAVEFYSRKRIEVDESLLEAVSTLGHQIGQTLERGRIADALRESERLKGAILASAPDCVITIDPDGRILEFNATAERTFGRFASEVIGHDIGATIFPADTQPTHRRAFARALDGDHSVIGRRIEVDAMHANGTRFPIEFSMTRTASGLHPLFTLHLRDITGRRREQSRLRESEARFRTIANAIPQLAWMTDPDGYITWYNQRWYDYTGTTFADVAGHNWKSVHHPDHVDSVEQSLRRSFASGEPWEETFPLRAADGSYRWFLSRARQIREEPDEANPAGRPLGWFGTNTDVTALRESEQTLAAARDEAEAANHAKSTFIANMSHELRTPLSAIIGYAEMMTEELEDSAKADSVTVGGIAGDVLARDMKKIEGNARHLLGLINDVLDLSKVEAGKMDAYGETFDVAVMVTEAVATVQALLAKTGNRLELRLPADLGRMYSDVTRIRQVLLNLLSNAAKFTENGLITVAADREPGPDGMDWLSFSVADTGIGMSPEQLARLFQRFQQADASTTRQFGGTGLGLALTKAFTVLLGGEISVRSDPGAGSTFTVRLPADLPQTAAPEQLAPVVTETDLAGLDVVLVVDDDATQRELMSRFLAKENFVPLTAPDGVSGLALARTRRPRAILLDVTMPGMDGWSVLSALKADAVLADIPVVMVTFVTERELASSLGAADYVVKPVNWERLRHVMERFRDTSSVRSVLVVDDEPDARHRTRLTLEKNGWTVVEAAHGEEALDRVAEKAPGIILLDLNMPVMDGFEFLHRLRQQPGCASIPVVVLTALDLTTEDRRRLRGAAQVLNKGDVSLRDLAERLRTLGSGP